MSFFGRITRYHNPTAASSVFLSKHHGRTGGYIEHFLAIKSIKKVPKERGTRSNAGLGASGYTLFSSFIIRSFFRFRLSRGYILFTILMICLPYDLSAERRLDVSFVLNGLVGKIRVMMDWGLLDIPGWASACGLLSRACLRADGRRGFSMIHRRYKAAPLREIGVIVSRPARLVGLLLSSHTPPSKSG